MGHLLDQPRLEKLPPYVLYREKLSEADCNRLVAHALSAGTQQATVGNADQARLAPEVRTSRIAWLRPNDDNAWAYERFAEVAIDARTHWYPFNLSGFFEPIQLTHYLAHERGHYAAHKDLMAGSSSTRKLSMVVLLNDASEFEGGQLELLGVPGPDRVCKLARGDIVVFPAWELHMVHPVTKGERWSGVVWVNGPPFR